VALASVGALLMLGGNVSDALQNMLSGSSPSVAATGNPSGSKTGMGTNQQLSNTVTITTRNGNTITLDGYPADSLSKVVYTSGANGTTKVLASNMAALAKKLLDAGEVNQEQYNDLWMLANQGHQLASIEAEIEAKAATLPPEEFQTWLMTSNLDDALGYEPPPSVAYKNDTDSGYNYTQIPSDPLNPPNGAQTELQKFLDFYHKAEQGGALSDPAIAAIVTSLATEIALVSEGLDQSQGAVYTGKNTPEQLTLYAASALTNHDSAGICGVGKGQDSGIHCKG
jgi:hypothetical protein